MELPSANDGHALVRLPVVIRATGLSRPTIYRLGRAGKFPRPRKLGERASAWRWADVLTWIESRPAA